MSEHLRDPEVSDKQALRIVRANLSWKEWFIQDYARYLYWLGALALDVFIILWIYQEFDLGDALGAFMLIFLGILLGFLEYRGFALVWEKGFLEADEED